MSVSAVPAGYRSVAAYLVLKDAAKAIEFYKKAFDAKACRKNKAWPPCYPETPFLEA